MSDNSSKEIRSMVTSDGNIEISIAKVEMPIPGDDEVLIEVHAAPINPSDLGLLFFQCYPPWLDYLLLLLTYFELNYLLISFIDC